MSLFRLETLLSVYPPVEILFDRSRTFPGLNHVLEKNCATSCRGFAFPAAKKTLKMLSEVDYFDAKGKSPLEAWPKDLIEHLDEGLTRVYIFYPFVPHITFMSVFRPTDGAARIFTSIPLLSSDMQMCYSHILISYLFSPIFTKVLILQCLV